MEKRLRVFRAHSRIPAELEMINFWRSGRLTRAANGGKVLAPSFSVVSYNTPFILPSHLPRTSSHMNFLRIQCNFILYKKKKKNTLFSYFFLNF